MSALTLEPIHLVGLSLHKKTSNENGQSAIDCGYLWQKFMTEGIAEKVIGKVNDDILAVYHDYDGDHTKPYAYFIGCRVNPGTSVPAGLDSLFIDENDYLKITTKGQMPDCVGDVWKDIWKTDYPRAYQADFEVYDERSKDWNNAEVDVYLLVK